MKLNIEFTEKSLDNAIKQLSEARQKVKSGQLIKDFLDYVCRWIIDRANFYLKWSDIGENVKRHISEGWEYKIKEKTAKILNKSDKAVFVEFGVGLVGQENRHEMVRIGLTNYQYNIGSKINPETNEWIFNVSNDDNIDIDEQYIVYRTENTVKTKGSPSVMFAFYAVVDAKNELKDPNSRMVEKWNVLLERYLG